MDDLVYRLRKRAEIRRQIPDRKSVQEGQPDRIADLLEEAADYIEQVRADEREACAKLCLEGTDMPVQVDALKIIRAERERISNAIRARGIDVAKVGEVGVWGDKREWVGLTDEEIYDYADKFLYQHGSNFGIKSFGKAIEAKLKEKNT